MNKAIFPLVTEEESKLPFYIKSIGGAVNQEHISRPSGYPEYHWLHCVNGKGILHIEGNEFIISENMGFFFHPGIAHEYYAISEPWETRWLTFNGYAVRQLLEVLKIKEWEVFCLSNRQTVEKLMERIYASAQSANAEKGFETSSLLYMFLLEIRNCIELGDSRQKYPKHKQLQPVISFIEQNYHENISLEDMSEILNVTPYHLCRLFKQAFDMRPFAYLTRFRIRKAKEMMMESGSEPVKEIASKVGYNDTSYFCAVFKEYEGLTPKEFRRMHKNR